MKHIRIDNPDQFWGIAVFSNSIPHYETCPIPDSHYIHAYSHEGERYDICKHPSKFKTNHIDIYIDDKDFILVSKRFD